MRPWTGLALTLSATVAAAGFSCHLPVAAIRSFGQPVTLAKIDDVRVKESSGVASSLREQGVFYTHNDSGDQARLFKFNADGKLLAEIRVEGARAVDWEDLASAKINGTPYLFVGDVGDNAGRRKSVTVYRLREPGGRRTKVDEAYELVYPDEPRNVETLLVHPKTGSIALVTKTSEGSALIYSVERPSGSGKYTLRRIGEVQVGGSFKQARLITGGAYSPDGQYVILRTYLGAYEFPAGRNDNSWFRNKPTKVMTNLEAQGEAITYTRRGDALITTSEGSPCQVSRIPIR